MRQADQQRLQAALGDLADQLAAYVFALAHQYPVIIAAVVQHEHPPVVLAQTVRV